MEDNQVPMDSGHAAQASLSDPNLVNKLVEELKSQGIFDQIRSDCLAEVDTKPAYQNLRQRLEGSVSRFLNKYSSSWKPGDNKAQLRNALRKHIQDSNYLEAGVQGIVDQVVGPKIMPIIEPEVEVILYKMLGIEKPEDDNTEEEIQNGSDEKEKLSNISSSDVDMQSEELDMKKDETDDGGSSSSPGPGLKGDISPLTPDHRAMSPLTPPPPGTEPINTVRTPSPRTPPLPLLKSGIESEVFLEEEVVAQEDMSPVSDAEFADISPPRGSSPETPDDSGMPSPPPPLPPDLPELPPPPPSAAKRPPSPLTSPIESSSESEAEKKNVSASDISDVELPVQSEKESSDDLEELEKAKAELEAKLAAADINSEDTAEDTSGEDQKSPSEEDDDHEMAKKRGDSKKDDDDSSDCGRKPDGGPDQPKSSDKSSHEKSSSEKSSSEKSSSDKKKDEKSSSHKHSSHGHRHSSGHHHHHHDHHKSRKSHKRDKDKEREKDKDSKSSSKKEKDGDKSKKEKTLKTKEKLEAIEAKVKEKCVLKSDKFKSFDMFAPKMSKPKVITPKPIKESVKPLPMPTEPVSKSNKLPASPSKSIVEKANKSFDKSTKSSSSSSSEKAKKKVDAFIVHESPRSHKVYPELPVPQTEGIDKIRQHKDDIAETKRRLEEARQRKLQEMMKNKDEKKRRKSSSSKEVTAEVKIKKPVVEAPDNVKRYETPKKNDDSDSDSDIEWQKKPTKKKRRWSSSSEEEMGIMEIKGSPIISTRKAAQKSQADKILEDDPEIKPNNGFNPEEDCNAQLLASEALSKYLKKADSDLSFVHIDPITDEELDSVKDYIFLDDIQYPGGPAKLVELLKKFGGNPRLVKPLPQWLKQKLAMWNLKRHQVDVVTEASKVRRRRIYTEREYDEKCGVTENKRAKMVMDDIEAQLAKITNQSIDSSSDAEAEDEQVVRKTESNPSEIQEKEIDEEKAFRGFLVDPSEVTPPHDRLGNTFGIEDMDLYETLDDDLNNKDPMLEVLMSSTLVSHMKKVLSADKAAMSTLNKIRGARLSTPQTARQPGDFPMPPSPESNSPSDGSDKGSDSPQNISSTNLKKALTPDSSRANVRRSARRVN